jgi:hypothetical protein
MTQLYNDIGRSLSENSDGHIIERVQQIPTEFLDRLKAERDDSSSVRESEMMRVASIPVVLIERWLAEGYDFYNESARSIVAKLKTEGMEYFLTTGKSV